MKGAEGLRVGDELRLVEGTFGAKERIAVLDGSGGGFVIDDPPAGGAIRQGRGAGLEDAVGAESAEAGAGGAGPGNLSLSAGMGSQNPLTDGIGGTGEEEIRHCGGCGMKGFALEREAAQQGDGGGAELRRAEPGEPRAQALEHFMDNGADGAGLAGALGAAELGRGGRGRGRGEDIFAERRFEVRG